jgi:hypothetical protein
MGKHIFEPVSQHKMPPPVGAVQLLQSLSCWHEIVQALPPLLPLPLLLPPPEELLPVPGCGEACWLTVASLPPPPESAVFPYCPFPKPF